MREFSSSSFSSMTMIVSLLVMILMGSSSAKLSKDFYKKTCPEVFETVNSVVKSAGAKEKRMGASLLRLHFHDCFVQGCDGSILLDNTSSFPSEKTAPPNDGSVRGYEIIDKIKSKVEAVCPGVVSCADIVAIAARDSVVLLGGPYWKVKVGRRDSRSASFQAAIDYLPAFNSTLKILIHKFKVVGLSIKDMVALSGAHTIGLARCTTFRTRIYNETAIDASFAKTRQATCPFPTGKEDNKWAPLDVNTPTFFDNSYFKNLISNKGLLHSDQVLYTGSSTDSLVESYSKNPKAFNHDFVNAMIRMAKISVLTGSKGEIRKNCRKPN